MKLTVSFHISDDTRRAISDRMPADTTKRTRTGLATRDEIQLWLAQEVLAIVDDIGRISECIALDCSDTDDDHDHMDGPKGYD